MLVAAIVTILGGLAWLTMPHASGPPDPLYTGHPLGLWLQGYQNTNGPSQPSLDAKAVPFLVQALKKRDGTLVNAYNPF